MARRRKSSRLEPKTYDRYRAPNVMRFAIHDRDHCMLEITCLTDEVDTVRAWIEQHGPDSIDLPLPVPESPDPCPPPARRNRWSLAAKQTYRAAIKAMPYVRIARRVS